MTKKEVEQLLKEMGIDFVECSTLSKNLQETRPDVTCRTIFRLGLVIDVTRSMDAGLFKKSLERSLLRMVNRLSAVLEKNI